MQALYSDRNTDTQQNNTMSSYYGPGEIIDSKHREVKQGRGRDGTASQRL